MSKSVRLFRGLPVHDATRATSITVTKRDLAKGKLGEPNYCVVAHAFKREQGREVVVHQTKLYIRDGNHWLRYPVPPRLRTEIVVFDRHGDFAEGAYELRPPAPYEQIDYKPARKRAPTARKQRHHRTPGVRAKPHYGEEE